MYGFNAFIGTFELTGRGRSGPKPAAGRSPLPYGRTMSWHISGLRTRWAAIGAAAAITLGAVGIGGLNIASADVSTGDRPVYIPINPCRLMDTRAATAVGPKSSPLGPGETVTVTAHGSNGECTGASVIPNDALSLSLNVTPVGPTSNTFLTFWGDGPNPGTSNLNPRAGGDPTPNAVNTPLSTAGAFNIFNNRGNVNVIVDVNGYYANHNHDDQYATLDHNHDADYAAAGHDHADAYVSRGEFGIDDFVFSGVINSTGLDFSTTSTPPPGVSATTATFGAGIYSIGFSGLSIDTFDPVVLLTPRNSIDRACTVDTTWSLSGPDGKITVAGVGIRCTDLVGVPAATAVSFQIVA